MISQGEVQRIETWSIERLVEYPRNPRKNDGAVDRMCSSIRELALRSRVWFEVTAKWSMATYVSKPRRSSA